MFICNQFLYVFYKSQFFYIYVSNMLIDFTSIKNTFRSFRMPEKFDIGLLSWRVSIRSMSSKLKESNWKVGKSNLPEQIHSRIDARLL